MPRSVQDPGRFRAEQRMRSVAAIRRLGRPLKRRYQNARDEHRLGQLARFDEAGARLAAVIRLSRSGKRGSAREAIDAIERERDKLLARHEPLISGEIGRGGIYDKDVTIEAACRVSKDASDAVLLHLLVAAFEPRVALELGTNVGISSAYQAAALAHSGPGRLVTLESSPYRQRIAREMHARLGLLNVDYRMGLFTESLAPALNEFDPVDYAFIDGDHQYQPTLDYFDAIWSHSAEGAVFVFDDIRWSEGMTRAWKEIRHDPRLTVVADLNSMGVCLGTRQPPAPRRLVTGPIMHHRR